MGFFRSLGAIFQPFDPMRLARLRSRWSELPELLRTPHQTIGRTFVACGATHGVHEACNFGCTACYLGQRANQQKPKAFEEVRQQLEAMRAYLGPGGNVQITSGEVTLLPQESLVKIIATARELDLSPMVMTHGDTLRKDPAYLDALVTEGGLTKISIHIDTTQRGRTGYGRVDDEAQLAPLRKEMADLLSASYKRTGRKLKAATTVTVNQGNLAQIPVILESFFENLKNFRILSFQPQAETGRTKDGKGVTALEVWDKIENWFGKSINPHMLQFGHQACNRTALLLVIETGKEPIVLQVADPGNSTDATLIARFVKDFQGIVFNDRPWHEISARVFGVVLRNPSWILRGSVYGVQRSWRERKYWGAVLRAVLTGKIRLRPCVLVVHAFMDREELTTEEGKERLKACMFKVPLNGEMVSMCEMNGTDLRESTYVV